MKTDVRGTKTEPGFISGYADLTESFRDSVFSDNILSQITAHTASASNNIFDGSIAGKKISFDVSAFDAARDRATLSTEALGGSISGTILSSSDITAEELIAAHIGYDVSGSSMQVRYDSKEVETRETAHGIIDILNPSNVPYSIALTINKKPKT